jgi:hypothetical protein
MASEQILCPACEGHDWALSDIVSIERTLTINASDFPTAVESMGDIVNSTVLDGWSCATCGAAAPEQVAEDLDGMITDIPIKSGD